MKKAWLLASCAVLALGCQDDCNVERTSAASKITAPLREQMQKLGKDVPIAVVITARSVEAVGCIKEAIASSDGPIARGVPAGTRSTVASLPVPMIERVAARADVQKVGVDFEESATP